MKRHLDNLLHRQCQCYVQQTVIKTFKMVMLVFLILTKPNAFILKCIYFDKLSWILCQGMCNLWWIFPLEINKASLTSSHAQALFQDLIRWECILSKAHKVVILFCASDTMNTFLSQILITKSLPLYSEDHTPRAVSRHCGLCCKAKGSPGDCCVLTPVHNVQYQPEQGQDPSILVCHLIW